MALEKVRDLLCAAQKANTSVIITRFMLVSRGPRSRAVRSS